MPFSGEAVGYDGVLAGAGVGMYGSYGIEAAYAGEADCCCGGGAIEAP